MEAARNRDAEALVEFDRGPPSPCTAPLGATSRVTPSSPMGAVKAFVEDWAGENLLQPLAQCRGAVGEKARGQAQARHGASKASRGQDALCSPEVGRGNRGRPLRRRKACERQDPRLGKSKKPTPVSKWTGSSAVRKVPTC